MTNIQHVTQNDKTQWAKLCMSLGANIGHVHKNMTRWTCNRLFLQQGKSQLLYLKEFIRLFDSRDIDLFTIP